MHRIALLVFDEVDLLDVGGPYEVLLTANRLLARRGDDVAFEVEVVGTTRHAVTAYGGLGLRVDRTLAEADAFDVVVVPGVVELDAVLADAATTEALGDAVAAAQLVATVCTGSVLLARLGHLDDIAAATTHHEDVPLLAEVLDDRARTARWVDAGAVVTSGGLSNGIAMALHLVERLTDRDLAIATAAQIEYDWDPDDGVVVAP